MTLGDLLSQMGIGSKHLTERFSHSDFVGPSSPHDSHVIYAYEPSHSSHGHVASSKHHHGGGGHKSNAAMSALTLLAFLFFLHILQQCLRDHMMAMSTPPVMIMTASREGEEPISKTAANKVDKYGKSENQKKGIETGKSRTHEDDSNDKKEVLMKINTAEHTPKHGSPSYVRVFRNYGNKSLEYRGFVSAMDEDFK
ncbi:uncharacterized protein LOC126372976 [Pectinophora gossypiella]|uniref:uncharacterized protein LOC126372976 n=1 Tax=Pectinophora gossypiella TaxID=13191 RepID=UPI00214EC1CE|nr:uncharacterized protein LOC126372976 [Pectinophora gossypiella]